MNTPDKRADWLAKELKKAYLDARRGKTKKPEVEKFDAIAESELAALAKEIHSRRYVPRTIYGVHREQASSSGRYSPPPSVTEWYTTFCSTKSASGGTPDLLKITPAAAVSVKARSTVFAVWIITSAR
ncbi:hypothetical protein H6801_01255 [Candidatus Nomurabacteria bacterium]|nr:hypothetical protein [Candidatus Nomurabacteria bacterium]